MSTISQVTARMTLDSRGDPAVEAKVVSSDNFSAASSCPSGASKGTYEAVELRDRNPSKYGGLGVDNAIKNVNEIIGPKIVGMDVFDQQGIDRVLMELDGTQNKSGLGANAILSVSQAVAKTGANAQGVPLFSYLAKFTQNQGQKKMPIPAFNLLEGGKHADNKLDFQEFLVIPASSKTFSEGFDVGVAIYHSLKKVLLERNLSTLNADEGGFAPVLPSNKDALFTVKQAIEQSGYGFSFDAFLGLDVASNSFYDQKLYKLKEKAAPMKPEEMVEYFKSLFSEFSLTYLEDPMSEDDWDGWKKIHGELGSKTLIVGDDLITTNPYRLQLALDNSVCSGIIVKPNQIGTVSEAIAVAEIAKFKQLKVIVSHRSGETIDDFISDFAVGINADYVKFGAPARERVVKYNRLLEIEREITVWLRR